MRKIGPACAILCVVTSLSGGPALSQVAETPEQPGTANGEAPPGAQPVLQSGGADDQPSGGAGVAGDPSAPGDAPAGEGDVPPVVTTGPISAWGDTLEQANLVLSRPRPGLDPQGIRLGSFTLLPSLGANLGYNDNIFATQTGKVGSATLAITPSLQLSRQYPGSSLSFLADGLIQRYTAASDANYEQFEFKGSGAFDLSSAFAVQAGAYYTRQAEPRGTSGDVSQGGEPSIFYNPGANIKVLAGTGPLQLQAGGSFDRFTYNSVQIGGVAQSQTYRNRDSYSANGQAGIEVGPGILTFVSGAFDRQQYDQKSNGAIANSTGYSVLGGVDLRLTKLVRGRIGVGYLWRNYSGGFSPLHGLNYDASLVWNVTSLLALTAKAAKTIEESPSVGSSGIIANTFTLSADYELIRRVIFSAKADYVREKYRAISRIDHRLDPGIVVHYLAGRYLSFDVGYTYTRQYGASLLARRYTNNVFTAGITLQK